MSNLSKIARSDVAEIDWSRPTDARSPNRHWTKGNIYVYMHVCVVCGNVFRSVCVCVCV